MQTPWLLVDSTRTPVGSSGWGSGALGAGANPTRLTPVCRRGRIGMGDRKEEPLWPG